MVTWEELEQATLMAGRSHKQKIRVGGPGVGSGLEGAPEPQAVFCYVIFIISSAT